MTDDFDLDHDLGRVLTRAADQLPDEPGRWAGVQRIRRRRRRRRAASVAGATALVLAGGVTAVVLRPAASDRATVVPAAAGQVSGQGTVIAAPGLPVRFCDPFGQVASAVSAAHPGVILPNPECNGVDAVGVDLSRLTARTVTEGIISGRATLQGRYADGVLHVDSQQPYTPAIAHGGPTYDRPPCPTPPGDWYQNGHTDNPDVKPAQSYQAAHSDQIVQFAVARPSKSQSLILMLTEGDPAPIRTALASAYPTNQICVARSNYTNAQVSAVETDPELSVSGSNNGPIVSTGTFLDPNDDQIVFQVSTNIETPAIAAAVARHPAGLVHINAWLKPT
ncbi:MAG TPA: hypothetical protein VIJ71_02200 [Mycobacteriales bacterium]